MFDVKVSVVIPIYNSEKFIRRCVESIEDQSYKNIELVLIDDASNDDSLEICYDLATEYDNIIVKERKENGGQMPARNDGLAMVTGEWLMFVDSDDQLNPTVIENYMKVACRDEPDIIFAGYETVDDNGEIHSFLAEIEEKKYCINEFVPHLFSEISSNILTCVGAKLYKADFIKKRKKKTTNEIQSNGDMAFIIDSLLSCDSVSYLNKVCYTYILRKGSITYSYNENKYNKIELARAGIKPLFLKYNCFDEKEYEYHLMRYSLISSSLYQEIKYKKGIGHFKKIVIDISDDLNAIDTIEYFIGKNGNMKQAILMKALRKKRFMKLYLLMEMKKIRDKGR